MQLVCAGILILLSFHRVNSACNECNPLSNTACVSSTQYVTCTNDQPNDMTTLSTCANAEKCANVASGCTSGAEACSNVALVTNTPLAVCTAQGKVARIKDPADKTCTKYFNCFLKNGSLTGLAYTCVGTTLFDPIKTQCVTGYTCPKA